MSKPKGRLGFFNIDARLGEYLTLSPFSHNNGERYINITFIYQKKLEMGNGKYKTNISRHSIVQNYVFCFRSKLQQVMRQE